MIGAMKHGRRDNVNQIADVANALIDPILARRAGISTSLLNAWEEIAGDAYADYSRPEKIVWPQRSQSYDDTFRPGTLTIACEGARALFLSHGQDELIHRVNGFFGFAAIDRIRIVQKPVQPAGPSRRKLQPLSKAERMKLDEKLADIESDRLKAAILRLATGVKDDERRRKLTENRKRGLTPRSLT
ncbi:DciA family protein [Martelella sp. HB161492]|uniref:DUF721 domain-containing protein n=1 Tax=Martelella sp. HB161492 TaxID=2720726 RepID=UPI001FEF7F4A|nr:DciA family protein [Martelella sp. HB161492]